MKVMLKPQIYRDDSGAIDTIAPSSPATWFDSYAHFITNYAHIAEDENVEMLCIGTGLDSMVTNASYTNNWKTLISTAKSIYSGPVVYSADWYGYDTCRLWNFVDCAGINAYFPLSSDVTPSVSVLISGWTNSSATGWLGANWVSEISNWQAGVSLPLIFSEILRLWRKEVLSMKTFKNVIVLAAFALSLLAPFSTSMAEEAKFKEIDPVTAVKAMSPAWNLGNSLDAIPNEDSWNNKPVKEETLDDIKKAGFNCVRIPVTWTHHTGEGPDFEIDEKWMKRVEQIVDWSLDRGFWTILNVHHDSWEWMSVMAVDPKTGKYVNDYDNFIVRLEKLWIQIADRFKDRSEKLSLEIINEPNDGQWEAKPEKPANPDNPAVRHDLQPEQMNDMNRRILKIIRKSGGYNDKRHVLVCGLGNDSEKTLKGYTDIDDPNIIMTVHYYTPWDFVSGWWGRYTWGSDKDKEEADKIFDQLNEKYVKKGLPVIVGEWGAFTKTEKFSKWYYYEYLAKKMYNYGMCAVWWDNGNDHFDREKRKWRDEIVKDYVVNAGLGIPNSFVMVSHAYVNKSKPVKDMVLDLELNGNDLVDIYVKDRKLIPEKDYIYSKKASTVILTKKLLKELTKSKDVGTVATLKFDFSGGTDQPVEVVLYDTPKVSEDSITVDKSKLFVASDLNIPTEFNGTKLAKIKLVDKAEGKPVIEDWVAYLKFHDHFDYTKNDVILKFSLLKGVKADSKLTLEFWPEGISHEIDVKYTDGGTDPSGSGEKIKVLLRFDIWGDMSYVKTKDPVKIAIKEKNNKLALEIDIKGLKGWSQDYLNLVSLNSLPGANWGNAKGLSFRIYVSEDFTITDYLQLIPVMQSPLNYWMAMDGVDMTAVPKGKWVSISVPITKPEFFEAIPKLNQILIIFNAGGPIEGKIYIDDFGYYE